jgi:hypothetical protein
MLDYQKFDEKFARQLAELRDNTGKPVFIVPGYIAFARSGMAIMTGNGVPAFGTPAKALKVLAEVVRYHLHVKNR